MVKESLWSTISNLLFKKNLHLYASGRNGLRKYVCRAEAVRRFTIILNYVLSWERKGVQLNAEFQRIAKRDKKAFLSDQWKEIEENSRMGKTRDLFKKIRDTKGTFHAKMGKIRDRNGINLT